MVSPLATFLLDFPVKKFCRLVLNLHEEIYRVRKS